MMANIISAQTLFAFAVIPLWLLVLTQLGM